MKMRTFARECNFYGACKDYFEGGVFLAFFDAYSLLIAGIVNNFIIFYPKTISFCLENC